MHLIERLLAMSKHESLQTFSSLARSSSSKETRLSRYRYNNLYPLYTNPSLCILLKPESVSNQQREQLVVSQEQAFLLLLELYAS